MAAAEDSWANVPDNIIVCISDFLPCRADRVHMACVSRHWRAAARGLGRPPPPLLPPLPALPTQLPWLIYPSTSHFYSVLGRNFHRLHGLPADVRAARCCGSGESGWLLLAFPHAYAFYNLNSGRRTPVPATFSNDAAELPLYVQHASFPAASPGSNGPDAVAAIARVDGRPTAAFWCQGLATWVSAGDPPLRETLLDVTHHGGWFYFLLMPGEQLIRIGLDLDAGEAVLRRWDLKVWWRPDYIDDEANFGPAGRSGAMKRYLAVSRDRLLMAVRYVDNQHGLGTTSVEVTQLSSYTTTTSDGEQMLNHIWEEFFVLEGRVMFLGPGCSRCFEVADDHNAATIYFLDDDDGEQGADDIGVVLDTGRYSQYDDLITQLWPPHVPLTWWLH